MPVKDQVLVRLHNAALNHRDLWIHKVQNSPVPEGIILGSEWKVEISLEKLFYRLNNQR